MRTLRVVSCLSVLILLTGCILSLYPYYTEEDIIFEKGLFGQWEGDNGDLWGFSQRGENAYTLIYTDSKGNQGMFIAHLFQIDDKMFLDFYPEDPELNKSDFYNAHILLAHSFSHIKKIEPELQMIFPDYRWLENHLKENPDAIRHEIIDTQIVLSAPTEELQAFWIKHLATEDAFIEPVTMQLRKPQDE